jgi:predicted HicB family RNase H-like nuclease
MTKEMITMAKATKRTQWQANQLVLRVTEQVKDAMRFRADKEGLSLNAWANRALARATGVRLAVAGTGAKRKGGAR